jgi:hypothetical protein
LPKVCASTVVPKVMRTLVSDGATVSVRSLDSNADLEDKVLSLLG